MQKKTEFRKETVKWTEYIQEAIRKAREYNGEYIGAFDKYRIFLENELRKNEGDTESVCQLAAVYNELNYKYEKIYNLLKVFIEKHETELTDIEKSRIYTNLGYYYDDQTYGSKRAVRTLRKAVKYNPFNSRAYYGLGRNYFGAGKYEKSEQMYEKAHNIGKIPAYAFEYANLLIINRKYEKAEAILEELLKEKIYGIKVNYFHILCKIFTSKTDGIIKEIDELIIENNKAEKFDDEEIAKLCYLAGYYEKSEKFYRKLKKQNYMVEKSWVSPYFYSIQNFSGKEEMEKEFYEIIGIKNTEITDIKNGEYFSGLTKEEKKEKIREIKREAKNLTAECKKILNTDYKPEVEIYPLFLYKCFLIDCPRHQKVD